MTNDLDELRLMHRLICELIRDGWIIHNKDIAIELCSGFYNILKEPYCHVCSMPGVETNKCNYHKSLYGFDRIYTVGIYYPPRYEREDLLSKHILSLKRDKRYAKPLGIALSIILRDRCPIKEADLITAVPLHQQEFIARGFNQSLEIANVLGSKLGIEVEHVLYKTKAIAMKNKSYYERKNLVKGLYELLHSKQHIVNNKYILLVDDIVTSGFTVSECSKILRDAGARKVDVIAVARTTPGFYRDV